MTSRIRLLSPDDAELAEVCALRATAFFQGATGRTIAEDMAGVRRLALGDGFEAALVAEDAGRIVGSCLFVRRELDPVHDLTPWLAGLVVRPERRGQGIGSRLVHAVEGHAETLGCRKLHLYTGAAETFYARLGWVVADRFVENGAAMCLMQKTMRPD